MSEHFATSADIYRILSRLPEDADQYPAADQGEKSPAASERRLARMLGMDAEQADTGTWYDLARYLEECQLRSLMDACARVLSRNEPGHDAPLVGAGVGRFLVRMLAERMDRPYIDFSSLIDSSGSADAFDAADCAPAVSVAALLQRKMRTPSSTAVGMYA
jgi:probable H4MPT-linked C1 transfer pathway protein